MENRPGFSNTRDTPILATGQAFQYSSSQIKQRDEPKYTAEKGKNAMKIIALEEHVMDTGIATASLSIQERVAPYVRHSLVPGLPAFPIPGSLEDIGEKRLADMDAHGIDMQVLSICNSAQFITGPEVIPLTQLANNHMADAVKAYPDRFAAFACLPMAHPKKAATELERTVKEFGFKGTLLVGRPEVDAVFLDNERYEPVLAMAENLQVPLYMHPGFPVRIVQEAYYAGLKPVVSARLSLFGWGWHAEVGVHILRMILSGVFDRYPRLQLITGHWGEMVPFFLDRLDEMLPRQVTGLSRTITETFTQQIYVTPSGMFSWPQFQFILEVMGADRIIYSIDYPFITNKGARAFLENAPISQEFKEKIAHGNAERLMNL